MMYKSPEKKTPQFSSALGSYGYSKTPTSRGELNTLFKQDKNAKLANYSPIYKSPNKGFHEIGKHVVDHKNYKKSPNFQIDYNSYGFVKQATIKLPNPRFSGFNPITGEDRNLSRSFSPFIESGRRRIDDAFLSRPFIS